MKVRNVSGVARGVTPAYEPSFAIGVGETAEVSDELGKSLLAQPSNWQPVRETATDQEEE